MTIRYDVTVDDQVAFALYHLYQSGRSSRGWRTGAAVWGIVAPLGVIAIMTVFGGKQAALMMLPLAAIPIFFIRSMLSKLGFRPKLRRLYEESLPREATGPHELELLEDGLVERTPYSQRWTPLQDILQISSDGERTFICFGPATAYVIPNRAVSEGDLDAFTEAIRARVSENLAEQNDAGDRLGP